MLRNYFKIAWRNLWKHKVLSVINIGGLAVGMAVALIIGLWIYSELSFNKNHDNYDRIAQVMHHQTLNGVTDTWESVATIMSEGLRNKFGSDFKYTAQGTWNSEQNLDFEGKIFVNKGSYFEPEIAEMLSLNMVRGSRNGLKEMNSILLSQSVSEIIFGNQDPMGKTLRLNDENDVKVTGVYKDLPKSSSFKELGFILPWALYVSQNWYVKELLESSNPWFAGGNTRTYVQLSENTNIDKVSSKIENIIIDNGTEDVKRDYNPKVFLHPMSKWHLYSEFENGVNVGGRIDDVWLFGIIGFFVLLLACINFINLSTARSEKRAKEVGVRKAIGSNRYQLISQFFSESILVSIIAFIFSTLLVFLMLPYFNSIMNSHITMPWSNLIFWVFGIFYSLFIGTLAGLYPALYLSSFKVVEVLKGVFKTGQKALLPRQVLVVSQFTVSIILIIGTIVVFQQIKHAENRPMGYDKNALITVSTTKETHRDIEAIRETLINNGAIIDIAESQNLITNEWMIFGGFDWDGKDSNLMGNFHIGSVNYNYGKTIGWKVKDGRDFSKRFGADSIQLILNESAVAFMGLKDPVGKKLRNPGEPTSVITIVGVVEDILIESPYEPVKPYIFANTKADDQLNEFLIKLNPEKSVKESLAKIESVFKKYNPSRPFEPKFVDEAYAKKFGNEKRMSQLVTLLSILAIFISCLGLFGLASYMAEQRTKEIGIRKVLGASIMTLWKMLSREFIWLVFVSCFIAIPIAYYFMDKWLHNYSYHTNLSWWIFCMAGVGALLVTLLVVSFQSIKAATANPIKSLRTE
ncbi:ABC transporter permease [Confluentibacter sediminis]|uniref:ABC transporter permease n=1 Tax=Confluentibacter sediminis TaxID=2219045 RepID=UPI000DAEBF32|nr:ABC transporter permease [Confluentibacter sediminis]